MPENISRSFSGIIIISNLFNRLNRNTTSRMISLFEMPIKKIINCTKFRYTYQLKYTSGYVSRIRLTTGKQPASA